MKQLFLKGLGGEQSRKNYRMKVKMSKERGSNYRRIEGTTKMQNERTKERSKERVKKSKEVNQ